MSPTVTAVERKANQSNCTWEIARNSHRNNPYQNPNRRNNTQGRHQERGPAEKKTPPSTQKPTQNPQPTEVGNMSRERATPAIREKTSSEQSRKESKENIA